ncbi:DUF4199 domain-containing protein [Tenacibaculum maritimum]|uniref:DUF4199 domain-containing protein n=1 Tax=Tenacibaculum maritimum TaxID=107401 RepID=UPI002306F6C5|nr:DUF4199 domain-containing protein [Tenacibaculum maritimum]MDB0603463.1 DUF4199 domain-containing protein [Tenacibaculum maritimum]MDB0612562.1 DUF4199 domain-containing protein [Tenacibaculum maritimum]
MENQINSKSIIINNGLILGIISILLSVTMYAMGKHLEPHWSLSIISGILFVVLIVMGIKQYKAASSGFISWGQAVKVGVGISLIAALASVIYNYTFVTFIEPDFMNQMMEIQNQRMLEKGMTDEQIDAANAMAKGMSSPIMGAAMGIISSAIIGFIISAIAGAVMKKTPEEQY